jgi:putative heme degradation protein
MPDRRYEVRVTGRLSQRARDAFAGMDVAEVTAETVISGVVHQDDQLHELLAMVQSLGLHVVAVQQVEP